MKLRICFWVLLMAALNQGVIAADNIVIELKGAGAQAQLGWRSQMTLPVSSMYSEYTILGSTNLQTWVPIGPPVIGAIGRSDEWLTAAVPASGEWGFFRVLANVKLATAESDVGDAVYGYSTEFGRQLQMVGQLSLNFFAQRFTVTNQYLPQITSDPTSVEYWTDFNLDPAVHNATNTVERRLTDFRLNTNEFAIFQTNGFVVSQRLGSYSFADAFYKVFTDNLPVYFSCDAALQAWHRSYMSMLEEVEETWLSRLLNGVVNGMANQVSSLAAQANGTAITNGVMDADYFLAVARSLSTGVNNYGVLGQTARVQDTLNAIQNLQPTNMILFGAVRPVDFSQFTVRGHYLTSQALQRYFRAMTWCSMVDLRFTGSTNDNSLRELSTMVAFHLLLKNSSQYSNWQQLEKILQMFVGMPDSLNFSQLNDLMTAAGIVSPANVPNSAALQNLQAQLMSGQLGVQNIQNGYFYSPLTREQIKLPRSFTVVGQRFALDAWAMGQCVFDKIIWDTDGIPQFSDKVMRRVPSALDIAFSVLGNNQTVPNIVSRIANTNGHPWRDGYPYQHNLAAARMVLDLQDGGIWTNNIYTSWVGCLRELSEPTTGPEYPDFMRTRNWAMKTLNTQLASWTELRHDTVLYVKQPYTGDVLCSYPDGFIEPRVIFWEKMRDMANRTKALLSTISTSGQFVFEPNDPSGASFTETYLNMSSNRSWFLTTFADTVSTLRDISVKELSRTLLSSNETFFIKNLIENPSGYSNARSFSGWYPKLYFSNTRARHSGEYTSSDAYDALVVDVHTDPKDVIVGDPGSILHEGVGTVGMLMASVNWGPNDGSIYAGPVFSHYEFELGPTTRETDTQWKSDVRAGTPPALPDWTQGFLVPGTFTFPLGIQ